MMISDLETLCSCLLFDFLKYICDDVYSSPVWRMPDEKGARLVWRSTLRFPPHAYPIHSHTPFDSILCLTTTISFDQKSPLSYCKLHSLLLLQNPGVYPWCLSPSGLWLLFLTVLTGIALTFQVWDLCFFQHEGSDKARHINPVFIYRSGTGQAMAIWDFPFLRQHWPLQWSGLWWRVRGSSISASTQPTEHHVGWFKYAKLCVVIKWNGPWSIQIWANYYHIN